MDNIAKPMFRLLLIPSFNKFFFQVSWTLKFLRTWFRNTNQFYPITSWLVGFNPKAFRGLEAETLVRAIGNGGKALITQFFFSNYFSLRFYDFIIAYVSDNFKIKFVEKILYIFFFDTFFWQIFSHLLRIFWNAF